MTKIVRSLDNSILEMSKIFPRLIFILNGYKIKDKNKHGTQMNENKYLENFLNSDVIYFIL